MNKQEPNISDAETYINEHKTARVTVKEITQEIDTHPSDFLRIFTRMNGITPKKYLDEQLKERLLQLLEHNNVTGTEASKHLGFVTEFSFYRWVKRVFGVTYKTLSTRTRKME